LADCHHDNDCGNTDNDAEHTQERAHLVVGDSFEAYLKKIQYVHFLIILWLWQGGERFCCRLDILIDSVFAYFPVSQVDVPA
jgi:hypothetical protein